MQQQGWKEQDKVLHEGRYKSRAWEVLDYETNLIDLRLRTQERWLQQAQEQREGTNERVDLQFARVYFSKQGL